MPGFPNSVFSFDKRYLAVTAYAVLVLWCRTAPGQEYSTLAIEAPASTASERLATTQPSVPTQTRQPESELAFIGQGSFGHFHIFANSWWSYLDFASIEYDRHSWGRALGARLDYAAEVQPLVVLRQPTKTTVWGTPQSKDHETLYGAGIMPIGTRLLWRDGKSFKPYFVAKGGVVGFDQKALSSQSAYMDFSLQFGFGSQFRLSPRWDGRVGFNFFHFSDAFIVPSNPGLDSMMYSGGLVYHLGRGSH
jgi:Lipid A 3-O-deacylase (PagL)